MARIKLSPKDCKTNKQVCSQKSDNFDVRGFWIIADEKTVTICQQKRGEPAKDSVTIPKKKFDKLIDWYTTKQ